MIAGRSPGFAIAAAAGLLTIASAAAAQVIDSNVAPPMILNTAPQDREVFLTWSTLPNATYSIRWRRAGDPTWRAEPATQTPYAAIDSLENGTPYQFELVMRTLGKTYLSRVAAETPRV